LAETEMYNSALLQLQAMKCYQSENMYLCLQFSPGGRTTTAEQYASEHCCIDPAYPLVTVGLYAKHGPWSTF